MRLPGRRSGVALAALVFAGGALAAQAPPVAGRSPGPRLGHASAFQERDRTLILFGGFRPDGRPLADTWAWDGSSWRELPVRGPSARRWPAMAYDAAHSRVVLHGGRSGVGREGEPLDDTWEWDGARWKLLALAGPGGRDHHRLVYDAERVGIVLFGGWDGEATRGDTWELVGSEWRRLDIEGPAPRAAHGLAYDQRQRQVVLFGGSSDTTFFGDTWRLRGGRWTLVDVPGPGARSFHGMAFDGERGVVVLVGGRRGLNLHGDTWTFDGVRWREWSSDPLPPRYVYDLTFDSVRRAVTFHGGGWMRDGLWTLLDETWALGEEGWRRVR